MTGNQRQPHILVRAPKRSTKTRMTMRLMQTLKHHGFRLINGFQSCTKPSRTRSKSWAARWHPN